MQNCGFKKQEGSTDNRNELECDLDTDSDTTALQTQEDSTATKKDYPTYPSLVRRQYSSSTKTLEIIKASAKPFRNIPSIHHTIGKLYKDHKDPPRYSLFGITFTLDNNPQNETQQVQIDDCSITTDRSKDASFQQAIADMIAMDKKILQKEQSTEYFPLLRMIVKETLNRYKELQFHLRCSQQSSFV